MVLVLGMISRPVEKYVAGFEGSDNGQILPYLCYKYANPSVY